MYTGSCLCGVVKVEIRGSIDSIIHCHCSLCRKNSGTAYATNGFVDTDKLIVSQGANNLQHYAMSPGKKRYFCKTCACPIYSQNEAKPERLRLRLGILDSDIVERPISHNFVTSKANWDDLDADLPRYEAHEPGRG